MSITEYNIADKILGKKVTNFGTLYFFKHIAIIEFNEGVHIDATNTGDTIIDLVDYFGQNTPFGLLANRVNSYSIDLLDVKDVMQILPNLAAYAVVSHNEAGRMNAEIENSFCKSHNISFSNIYEGLDFVCKRVKTRKNVLLN